MKAVCNTLSGVLAAAAFAAMWPAATVAAEYPSKRRRSWSGLDPVADFTPIAEHARHLRLCVRPVGQNLGRLQISARRATVQGTGQNKRRRSPADVAALIDRPAADLGSSEAPVHAPMGTAEFAVATGCLMALTALATDVMLAVLPDIARALDVVEGNSRQLVIVVFLVGFGVGQLIVGAVSDGFGRKPVLLVGLVAYVVFAALSATATDFEVLLAARLVQGLAAAVPRVVCLSIVRDCYSGTRMARVLSLASMILIVVPIVAPYVGQALAMQFSWRAPFLLLSLYGLAIATWILMRLPETSPGRESLRWGRIIKTSAEILRTRQSAGYIIAGGAMYSTLFAFVFSGQQLLGEHFALQRQFPLAFGGLAVCAVLTSLLNSILVGRLGMRLISHAAVIAFLIAATAMWTLHAMDMLGLAAFLVLAACCLALLSLIFANFNALAMEPWSQHAGAASSLLGAGTTLIASGLGHAIGQAYDGSAGPLAAGFVICAVAALAVVLATERGRLFGVTADRQRESR